MATLHPASNEHLLSELDLFRPPSVQLSIDHSRYHVLSPLSSIDSAAPLTFSVIDSTNYLDLSESFLYLKLSIVQANNQPLAPPADLNNLQDISKVFPVNCIGTSLFKDLEIHVGSKLISSAENLYGYKAYFENLLSYSDSVQRNNLSTSLFVKDTAGQFNSTVVHPEDQVVNEAARIKWLKTQFSRPFEVVTRIHNELFTCPRLLLNNLGLTVRFTRADPRFYLMSAEQTGQYKIEIQEAYLYICHKAINPSIRDSHIEALQKYNALYPVTRGICRYYSHGPNRQILSENTLYTGRTPERVFVALLDTRGFAGHLSHNPFYFKILE